jgi:23S rRNA (cytidine1920-2'-O)/16S rRNA (cytidine1409-2'-O)-methyltransferase
MIDQFDDVNNTWVGHKERHTTNMKKEKCTLFYKLINEGWFDTESEALPWIMARRVLVNDQLITSGNEKIISDSEIRIREYYKRKYVNKGGLKLESALNHFHINVDGMIALDCGASTGGFTDCLLRNGISKVYAVDAGFGQLAGKLSANSKVINMERTNLSSVSLCNLDPVPDIITLDLSYLSLTKALPLCESIFNGKPGIVVCLVKPIYEVDSPEIRRTGKINNKDTLRSLLKDLCQKFEEMRISVLGITNSPITGNNGTLEYFILVKLNNDPVETVDNVDEQIDEAINNSFLISKFEKDNYVIPGSNTL